MAECRVKKWGWRRGFVAELLRETGCVVIDGVHGERAQPAGGRLFLRCHQRDVG